MRPALVTSVTWRPVSFQISHESIVPKSTSPASARARSPSIVVEQPADLRPGEVRRERQPAALAEAVAVPRRPPSSRTRWSVRMSCQLIALWTGTPVSRSHSTVVSRWFVIPSPTRSAASSWAVASASPTTYWTLRQISAGSCSTSPGPGKIVVVLDLADGDDPRPARRTRCSATTPCPGRPTRCSARSPAVPTTSRRHHGIAPEVARDRARGLAHERHQVHARRAVRVSRSTGPEIPIAPTVTPRRSVDRRRERDLADSRAPRRRRPSRARAPRPARPSARPRSVIVAGVKPASPLAASSVAGVAVRGQQHLAHAPWRAPAAARRPRAPGGCRRAGTRGARRAPAPSCSVPMRTLSPLRAASESDQFSARVRSSLPSR